MKSLRKVYIQAELVSAIHDNDHRRVYDALNDPDCDPNYRDNDNTTPLMTACYLDEDVGYAIIEMLLIAGADPNATREHNERSPIHIATCHGELEVVKLLVEHGADLSLKDYQGATPYEMAQMRSKPGSTIADKSRKVLEFFDNLERDRRQA